jgi:hypothetical protein
VATANTVSAVEGKVTILSGTGVVGGPITLLVTKATINKRPTLAENTNATTNGWESRKLVKKGAQIEMTVQWDATKVTEDCGLDQGDEIVGSFRIGSSAKQYASVNLIVGDVSQVTMSTEGLVTQDLTAHVQPPGLPDPTPWP